MAEDDDGSIAVSVDGISVHKRIETERFPTLAVELEITSERDVVSNVRLTEDMPADIPADDIGFHPSFGEEYWSFVDDNTAAFDREFEPGESYTTIYGFRDFPDERSEELLGEPVVEVDSLDTEPDEVDTPQTAPADSPQPASDSLVRTIAREFERGIAGPEERRMLREQLQRGESAQASRIEALQERVSDFDAYVDALEEFLRKEGTAEQVFERFTADINALESELERLSEEYDPVVDESEALESELDQIEEEIESAESSVDQLAERLDGIDDVAEDLDSQIDGHETDIEDLSSEIHGVDDRIDDVGDEISTLETELDEIRRDLREDIRVIEDDLDDFAALRDRLASVFGSDVDLHGSGETEGGESPTESESPEDDEDETEDEDPESDRAEEDTATAEDTAADSQRDGDDDESGEDELAEE